MQQKELQKVALTSIFVALAFVFSLLTKYVPGLNLQMPQGGSVFGIAMLPIMFIGMIFGVRYGIIGGMLYGLVSLLLDGILYHWASLFTDYLIAFGFLGLTGLFKDGLKSNKTFVIAILCVGFLRYLSHSIGGVVLFSEFAPEGVNPWFYSFVLYNLPYMASSIALCLVIGLLLRKQILLLAQQNNLLTQ